MAIFANGNNSSSRNKFSLTYGTGIQLGLVIVLLSVVFAVGRSYALLQASLDQKVSWADAQKTFVGCDDFQHEVQALREQLNRIEDKLDYMMGYRSRHTDSRENPFDGQARR